MYIYIYVYASGLGFHTQPVSIIKCKQFWLYYSFGYYSFGYSTQPVSAIKLN